MSQTHTHTQALPATSAARPAGVLAALTATEHDWTQTALRVTLGAVMLPHGAQKLLGAFGGYGFEGTMGYLTGPAGLPWIVAFLVIFIEFFGALALIAGLLSRPAALGVAAVMIGAVVTVHLANDSFMNWTGAQAGEGFEYHLLALVLSLAVMIRGGGAASADRAIAARLR